MSQVNAIEGADGDHASDRLHLLKRDLYWHQRMSSIAVVASGRDDLARTQLRASVVDGDLADTQPAISGRIINANHFGAAGHIDGPAFALFPMRNLIGIDQDGIQSERGCIGGNSNSLPFRRQWSFRQFVQCPGVAKIECTHARANEIREISTGAARSPRSRANERT